MLLALLVVGLFPSQVHFEDGLTLADVAKRADWVVVVKRDNPQARWEVGETLNWRGKGTAPSGPISVAMNAHQEFNEQVADHIAKHGYQGVPSPIWKRYVSSVAEPKLDKQTQLILFLRPWKTNWQLAEEGAWESVAKRDFIVAVLKQP